MNRASDSLSLAEARRVAIAAQGFAVRSRRPPTKAAILACVRGLGVVQLDSVNVVCRAHYLPLFARLGAYDRDALDRAAWGAPRELFEYWGHEASLLPVSLAPLFRWRMERAVRGEGIWKMLATFARERRKYVDEVLATVAREGPLRAGDLQRERSMAGKLAKLASGTPRAKSGWWNLSDGKRALEWLFWTGRVTTSSRTNFARIYDLTERVLPSGILAIPTPSEANAQRELLRIAARALGIATEDDLADYFRLKRREARPFIDDLVEEGSLRRVAVEGWTSPAFLAGPIPRRREEVAALLAPFDPLVWYRARAHRLFDFHYRIGIYTPAHERTHGYYVLPFLLGDRLVARVDLKAEREAGILAVRSAHVEPHASPEKIAEPLAAELLRMASWLGLSKVNVARKGKLATALRSACS
jgi:uncharacterized protein YcaQ